MTAERTRVGHDLETALRRGSCSCTWRDRSPMSHRRRSHRGADSLPSQAHEAEPAEIRGLLRSRRTHLARLGTGSSHSRPRRPGALDRDRTQSRGRRASATGVNRGSLSSGDSRRTAPLGSRATAHRPTLFFGQLNLRMSCALHLARPEGFEPPTTRFEAWCSNPAELRARDGKPRRYALMRR